jgi:hypothetical protein
MFGDGVIDACEKIRDSGHDDAEPQNNHQVMPVRCIRPYWISCQKSRRMIKAGKTQAKSEGNKKGG